MGKDDLPTDLARSGSLTWDDGWQTSAKRLCLVQAESKSSRNWGCRVHGRFLHTKPPYVTVCIRNIDRVSNYNIAVMEDGKACIAIWEERGGDGKTTILASGTRTLGMADEFTLEIIGVGDRLIGRCNGETIGPVKVAHVNEGRIIVNTTHVIRDMEVLNLDGLPEAEALKVAGFPER
jgi:hypothetical protein